MGLSVLPKGTLTYRLESNRQFLDQQTAPGVVVILGMKPLNQVFERSAVRSSFTAKWPVDCDAYMKQQYQKDLIKNNNFKDLFYLYLFLNCFKILKCNSHYIFLRFSHKSLIDCLLAEPLKNN